MFGQLLLIGGLSLGSLVGWAAPFALPGPALKIEHLPVGTVEFSRSEMERLRPFLGSPTTEAEFERLARYAAALPPDLNRKLSHLGEIEAYLRNRPDIHPDYRYFEKPPAPLYEKEFYVSKILSRVSAPHQKLDILTIEPRPHSGLSPLWDHGKRGLLLMAAECLEFFDSDKNVFYAVEREGLWLYYALRLATRGETGADARVRRLAAGQFSRYTEGFWGEVRQAGIDLSRLDDRHRIVLLDSTWTGGVARILRKALTPDARYRVQTFLMASGSAETFMSRVAFGVANPLIPLLTDSTILRRYGWALEGTLPDYEARLIDYLTVNGKSVAVRVENERLDPTSHVAHMEDLAYYFAENRALLERTRRWLRHFVRLAETGNATELISDLKKALKEAEASPETELLVRDIIERYQDLVSTRSVVLEPESGRAAFRSENSALLAMKFPRWAPIFLEPQIKIPDLIRSRDYGTLARLADAVADLDFKKELCRHLEPNLSIPELSDIYHSVLSRPDDTQAELLRWQHGVRKKTDCVTRLAHPTES